MVQTVHLIVALFIVQALILALVALKRGDVRGPERGHQIVAVAQQPQVVALGPIPVSVSNAPAQPPYRVYQSPRISHPDFSQVGFVYTADKSTHTPLYGRPAPRNPNRWQYYTRSNSAEISVSLGRDGRDCMSDIGCEELQTGDTVTAQELSDGALQVKMYDGASF
jgi:hypothetical protein